MTQSGAWHEVNHWQTDIHDSITLLRVVNCNVLSVVQSNVAYMFEQAPTRLQREASGIHSVK